jgi:hypothetical protein
MTRAKIWKERRKGKMFENTFGKMFGVTASGESFKSLLMGGPPKLRLTNEIIRDLKQIDAAQV